MRSAESERTIQTIVFKSLPDQAALAADFLQSHVEGPVTFRKNQIQVEGVGHKEIKLLLHKFLHHQGLDGYRVLSRGRTLEVGRPRPIQSSKHDTGTVPSAATTMPYFFPGTANPLPAEKKSRRREKP